MLKNLFLTSFRPLFVALDHICQLTFKVACKVEKCFLKLFHVTLIKIELQKSNLHQMIHGKVYFLTCFMQNVKKLNILSSTVPDLQPERYGGPFSPL